MKYVRPQIISVQKAVDTILSSQATKPGPLSDGINATAPAYEADE